MEPLLHFFSVNGSMDDVETPPPLRLNLSRLSPTIDDVEQLGAFLTEKYGKPFDNDDDLGTDTYRRMDPYTHIYQFNNGSLYLIKFSSDPTHKDLIQHEWNIYTKIYRLKETSYFIQGIEGGTFKGCAYIILPLVNAKSLEESIAKESIANLSKSDIFRILSTVADALVYLLANDICHGDMHAGNILLTDDGVKIIDFDKAGPCDEMMNVGYTSVKNRKALRKDLNFIGVPYNTHTGFFVMVKDIFRKKGISVNKIDEIIDKYINSNSNREEIEEAYVSMKDILTKLQKGGRRTRRRRRRVLNRRVTSSK